MKRALMFLAIFGVAAVIADLHVSLAEVDQNGNATATKSRRSPK